jgi:hypothetical protein
LSAGFGLGAAVSGGILAAAAGPVATLPSWIVAMALAGCAGLGLADVAGRAGLTFPRRQTFSGAVAYGGRRLGHLIWGFDVGLGFTTYRTSRVYWCALVMLVAGGSVPLCFAGTAGYAVALLVSIRRGRFTLVDEERMVRSRRRLGVVGAAVALGLMTMVVMGGG